MNYYLAIDIGASSGRHIIGYMDHNEIKTVEVYRFENSVCRVHHHFEWDIDSLFTNVKEGIKQALIKYPNIQAMSIDTWGVDYVLMNGDKEIYPCYSYRDERTKEVIDEVHSIIPFKRLYEITGSQFQEFNTIYQLYCDKKTGRLQNATTFLHIPEYLMYKLTGVKIREYTNASTTGMLDCITHDYSKEIINQLGFKESLFSKLNKPKVIVGYFTCDVAKEVGGNILVKLCPTHDTASAVEGIPMKTNNPYISSGTWSLLGIKRENAITNSQSMNANYSNECGPDYFRFQKNIMGLWIIQCLAKEFNLDFPTMVEMSKNNRYSLLYDVNDSCFLSSTNMKDEIINWFHRHNLEAPKTKEDIINCTYRSLALSYKVAIEELEEITNKKYDSIYIVGGGAKNQYLNELTEEFTKHKVLAFPIEATAIGNLKTLMEE